jgi:hypothetical protein
MTSLADFQEFSNPKENVHPHPGGGQDNSLGSYVKKNIRISISILSKNKM